MNVKFVVRPATIDDEQVIKLIVRAALINPLGIDWRRFVIVEQNRDVVGIGQIKPHRDGTLELASIAVVAEWQGLGIGSAIVQYLSGQAGETLYAACMAARVSFYQRFGFRVLSQSEIPPSQRWKHRVVNTVLLILRRPERLMIMRRDKS